MAHKFTFYNTLDRRVEEFVPREEGRVSIESKKGWMLKGKVLRAAQGVVSSGKKADND